MDHIGISPSIPVLVCPISVVRRRLNTLFPSKQHPIKYPPGFTISDIFVRNPSNVSFDSKK